MDHLILVHRQVLDRPAFCRQEWCPARFRTHFFGPEPWCRQVPVWNSNISFKKKPGGPRKSNVGSEWLALSIANTYMEVRKMASDLRVILSLTGFGSLDSRRNARAQIAVQPYCTVCGNPIPDSRSGSLHIDGWLVYICGAMNQKVWTSWTWLGIKRWGCPPWVIFMVPD